MPGYHELSLRPLPQQSQWQLPMVGGEVSVRKTVVGPGEWIFRHKFNAVNQSYVEINAYNSG